jgi:hypothetical protein
MYCEELEVLDDEDDGRGGSGDTAVGASSVANSSVLPAGAPQFEQNRPVPETSVPQDGHVNMIFPDPVYRFKMELAGAQDPARGKLSPLNKAPLIYSCYRADAFLNALPRSGSPYENWLGHFVDCSRAVAELQFQFSLHRSIARFAGVSRDCVGG